MGKRNGRRVTRTVWAAGAAAAVWIGLAVWCLHAENTAHYTPEYGKTDVSFCLEREELTEEDYRLLLQQTGLGRASVDALLEPLKETDLPEAERERILKQLRFLQERLFALRTIDCAPNTPVTRQELFTDRMEPPMGCGCFVALEDGDILVTFNCHFLGWRSGHAGMVVDAEKGLVLEATELGSDSRVCSLEHWADYPSVAVLRLRDAPLAKRKEIADYAAANLVGLPYRLSAGVVPGGQKEESAGTQCAYLIWSAYEKFGFDLDGDGGLLVTPRDLYESTKLEIIQVYGLKLETFTNEL